MKHLLVITEQGGYPDFTSLYEKLGYQVIMARSMRKALGLVKEYMPDVITAEFIYSPMYSARISNLESLFAALQRQELNPQLLVFIDAENLHHLEKLESGRTRCRKITYPVTEEKIMHILGETTALSPG